MYCKRGIYVNWGNIPNIEFDFGPINLFSGGNGSGKTTAADGLQSLMTAAHENLFTYNPGQDETTQKGRGGKQVRTLASYILGCDDGSYARLNPTDGYVAGVFHPTEGESGDVFTAVMCVRARLDNASAMRQARQDDLLFIIIPNHELSLTHFVRQASSSKYVVPITEIVKLLRMEFGKEVVEVYEKKGPYLRRLYGALRGLRSAVSDREAKHAARTFSNFMAYKPVKSITEFVAREILEPKDLSEDIRQVSELMKTIHSMDEETRQMKLAIDNLEQAKIASDSYLDDWIEHCVGQYCEVSRQLYVKQQEYLKQKKDQRVNLESIEKTNTLLRQNAEQKQRLHSQLIELQAQRQGIAALKDKDQLEADIERVKDQLVQQVAPLLEQDQQFGKNYRATTELNRKLQECSLAVGVPALDTKHIRQSIKELLAAGESTELDAQQLLTKDWVGISSLENKLERVNQLEAAHASLVNALHENALVGDDASIRDQVFAVLNTSRQQLDRVEQQCSAKRLEIQQLQHHKVSYPPHVQAAVDAIVKQCPEARPCVLCDFVEVVDTKWQMAIEGYIGGARFSIIVEPDFEAQAIAIVRAMKVGRNSARVIQGAKAQRDAAKLCLPSNSIVEVMTFEHKIVEYYIKASYGTVVRVDNEQTLRKTARGLTDNGIGSGNYSMFRCDVADADLVFGQGARERALLAKQQQLDALNDQSYACEQEYHHIARIHELIALIRPVQSSEIIRRMLDFYHQLHKAETQLENLDLSDYNELESRLDQSREQFAETEQQGSQLSQQLGALNSKIQQFERLIHKLANEQEQLQLTQETHENAVKHISVVFPAFDADQALQQADQKAQSAGVGVDFLSSNRDCLVRMDKNERVFYEALMRHNQMSNSYNGIVYYTGNGEKNDAEFFAQIVKLSAQVATIYNSLKNNVLVGKHEKLSALKDSFNTAFVSNLCHSIYQSINDGKRTLEDLNKELEHHMFGTDRERFYFAWDWVPEFREYWRFFKEVIDIPSLGDGTSLFDAQLSEKSCRVRDKLLAMLLDKDEQSAQRELKRISDYRHYRHYEIYKQPENKEPIALSKYGTGSGGQLETPAYIIRSAAVTSAFRFNEGNAHCKMVLVDEAFSKMDETRSREVINYLTEALGLQLIFIMPTSKSGPFMDLISNQVIFSKCPTRETIGELNSRVLVDRKICNQEKIQKLWANHRKTIRQQAMLDFMDEFV